MPFGFRLTVDALAVCECPPENCKRRLQVYLGVSNSRLRIRSPTVNVNVWAWSASRKLLERGSHPLGHCAMRLHFRLASN